MTRDYSQFLPRSSELDGAERMVLPLDALGWHSFFAGQTDVDEMAQMPPVRVFRVHRNALDVVGDGIDESIPPLEDVTVGDWLLLDREGLGASRVLERKSLVKRRAPGIERQVQLIAANIDTAFIVTSCNQDFNLARLERYVALVFEAEITPVIVLTKSDLVEDPSYYVDTARAISDLVDVVALNARSDEPRQVLAQWCRPGATVAFLGSSGVGKSTLTNALLDGALVETQSIREDDAKGRHTTTRRELYAIPNGCLVLDTPGMRELQMTDAASGIEGVFADISELAGQCRFNNCLHESEPGCAVLEAVKAGDIDLTRLGRYRKLKAEDVFNSASLSERRANDKAFGKMVRATIKGKKGKRR